MRILNSCAVQQDSILQTTGCAPAAHFQCSTARIRQDISAGSFCSCKLLWVNDECALLPCFTAQPGIFAVMNCGAVALNLYSCDIPTLRTSPKCWFGNIHMTSNCDSSAKISKKAKLTVFKSVFVPILTCGHKL